MAWHPFEWLVVMLSDNRSDIHDRRSRRYRIVVVSSMVIDIRELTDQQMSMDAQKQAPVSPRLTLR